MAYEKSWKVISPRLFTANGGVDGLVTIADTLPFKVKQQVIIQSSTTGPIRLQINRVENHTQIYVGMIGSPISSRADISAFLVADGATIEAPFQVRSSVPEQEIERLTYDEEPTVARRTVLVDEWGDYYTLGNPLPVNAILNLSLIHI